MTLKIKFDENFSVKTKIFLMDCTLNFFLEKKKNYGILTLVKK